MSPILEWFINNKLSDTKAEAKRLKIKATKYHVYKGVIFKKYATCVLLRCLWEKQSNTVLKSLHEGECGNHTGGRSLADKALRTGYFWPTMRKDDSAYARSCNACQIHADTSHPTS